MPTKPLVLAISWLPEVIWQRLREEFPEVEARDGRERPALEEHLPRAAVVYGTLPAALVPAAAELRWLQLNSAGVAADLCAALTGRGVQVTNLAGLYGPSIAEHTLALMLILARNLRTAICQQQERRWQRDLARTMTDLRGRTAAVVGLGNIGQAIARLCRACGMRIIGCRRTPRPTPWVDRLYPVEERAAMFAEADYIIVAAPLTRETDGLLGPAEFAAMKRGAFFVNISRGRIAREDALIAALRAGHLAGAGLDVFAVEPLAPDHPLWDMPQVVITPHCSGEVVNQSSLPGELFLRNLRAYLDGRPLGHVVDLDRGY
jgi:phosphoglycerate dehydrogenase-like enzyme